MNFSFVLLFTLLRSASILKLPTTPFAPSLVDFSSCVLSTQPLLPHKHICSLMAFQQNIPVEHSLWYEILSTTLITVFNTRIQIAKMLQNLANKPSYAKEAYMITLNPFVENNKARINQFLNNLCEVGDFYDTLEVRKLPLIPLFLMSN